MRCRRTVLVVIRGYESSEQAGEADRLPGELGADIAIVHSSTSRILLYQAKLARLDGSQFDLKSDATTDQIALLNQASVTVDGRSYSVTGRLALYQADVTPFLDRCSPDLWIHWRSPWHWGLGWPGASFDRLPEVGRWYYEEILRFGCSPSGVVAAPASGTSPISSVAVTATWPWEFDTHTWLRGGSPVDRAASGATDGDMQDLEGAPEFGDYQREPTEERDGASAFAEQLADQLSLAETRQLFLILL